MKLGIFNKLALKKHSGGSIKAGKIKLITI